MELKEINDLIGRINGCTFASLDTLTIPSAGIRKETTGTLVLLFTNKTTRSGYENMVKRRLADAGLDPSTFTVDELPWGERVPGTPLIKRTDTRGYTLHYLQTILLKPGKARYYIGTREIDRESLTWLRDDNRESAKQGLIASRQVVVNTYLLASITAIRMMGEEVVTQSREGKNYAFERQTH